MTFEQTVDTTTQTTEPTQAVDTGAEQVVDTTQTNTEQNDQTQEPGKETVDTPETDLPESPDAYQVELEGFDFDAFKADNAEVLKDFHAEGMTNKQVEAVVKAYEQHQSVQMEALQQEWGEQFGANVNLAKNALEALGFDAKELDSPIGALKLAAAIGKHIQEDLPPQNAQQSGSETIQQLMMSEAYSNPSHPDHKSVAQRVDAWYSKQYVE